MRIYNVRPDLFVEHSPECDHSAMRRAVGELIERYDVRGRRVLALGAGSALEERWFAELGGNTLTVVDIDEHGSAEATLRSGPAGAMRYIIGDALTVDAGEHDVVYASGFTPDERRRYALIWGEPPGTTATRWRPWWNPFHPGLMRHARRLRPGGLVIVQSVTQSLNVDDHPLYVPTCRAHLALRGLRLLELWRFTKTKGVMLYVAQKRGGARPPMQTPLTMFHARAAAREPIERVYP